MTDANASTFAAEGIKVSYCRIEGSDTATNPFEDLSCAAAGAVQKDLLANFNNSIEL